MVYLPLVAQPPQGVVRAASLCRLYADLRQPLTTSQTTQAQLAEARVQEVA